MFKMFKKKETDNAIYAPVDGKLIQLSEVKDQVFSEGMMGPGIAFDFQGDELYSPCNGKVMLVAETKHAIGIQMDNGAELLIHVGFDTVNLSGQGFTVLVKAGDTLKTGTALIKIDRAFMASKEIDLVTPMVVTNGDEFELKMVKESGAVSKGELLYELVSK